METITVVDQITATLQGADAKGNRAALLGVPGWATSDPTILAVSPAADGMTAVCAAGGKIGVAVLTITAVPQKADGTPDAPISITVQVSVTGSEATQLIVTFGAATVQSGAIPAPPPPPPPPPAPVG